MPFLNIYHRNFTYLIEANRLAHSIRLILFGPIVSSEKQKQILKKILLLKKHKLEYF